MMFYLAPHISAIEGVCDLLADSRVDENGRHTVLVNQAAFQNVRNAITQNLDGWIITHVSSDAQPKDEQFSGPARVKPIHNDGMSSGANSWMSTSNASFMSMDFTAVQDQSYFTETTDVEQVFTYANIVMPPRPTYVTGRNDTVITDDITTDVASELTEMENRQKQEIERLAEAHRAATVKAEEVYRAAVAKADKLAEEQRLEIAQLKAQRQTDLEAHAREQRLAAAKVQAQEEATSDLRNETKAELRGLKDQMNAMMATFQAAGLSRASPAENKRTHAEQQDIDNESNSQSDEKRQDVRSTPGKQLFHDEMDLEDPALSQQKLNDAPSTPKKQDE
jgi:hypothetical protein